MPNTGQPRWFDWDGILKKWALHFFSSTSNTTKFHARTNLASIDRTIWHRRLGHLSDSKLNSLQEINSTIPKHNKEACHICPSAKQTRKAFPKSTSISSKPFELLHLDIWGKFHTPTHNGLNYFLTIVDDHSRATWVLLMKNKVETYPRMKQFLQNIYNQYETTVKSIRSNNGRELTSKEFQNMTAKLGIHHQLSCIHTPQQNGMAERKHRHILEIAKALMKQSNLPLSY